MHLLLIDHITKVEPKNMIKDTKNVAMSDDFLEFHFPKNSIMPGVLLLEALAQLTGNRGSLLGFISAF
jgi:3-hydroxyacyl-[acyl-carrier-protein] dehydratase